MTQKEKLKSEIKKVNGLVEPIIKEILTNNVEKQNREAVSYQCNVGGKRIRPFLAVMTCQMLGGKIEEVIYPAAALEILHNSTLIIDDIIDHSEFRRNEPTTWKKYGQSIAECVTISYVASIFEAAKKTKNNLKVMSLFAKTLKIIVDGEIKDILFERSGRDEEPFVVKNRYKEISKKDYLDMVSKKTAVLLESSCQTGAICADAKEKETKLAGGFGYNLGMAFQIQDDILDIFGKEKDFGKKVGKDLVEKKMGNFVILEALSELKGDDKVYICNLLKKTDNVEDKEIVKVIGLIKTTSAKAKAQKEANKYMKKALECLVGLPENDYKEILAETAKYVVERNK